MVKYICDRCGIEYENKTAYIRHLKRKFMCEPSLSDMNTDEILRLFNERQLSTKGTFQCSFCKKSFANRHNKSRHEKTFCKIKRGEIAPRHNDNMTLKVNPFGKPDMSHIKDKDYIKAIQKGNLGIPYIIEQIYFNPKKRENHSFFISNKKQNYVSLYNGQKWKYALCDETIRELIIDNMNMIEDKIEEWHDTNHRYTKKYEHIIKKFPRFLDKFSVNEYVSHKVFEETKLLVFNNKDMISESIHLLK